MQTGCKEIILSDGQCTVTMYCLSLNVTLFRLKANVKTCARWSASSAARMLVCARASQLMYFKNANVTLSLVSYFHQKWKVFAPQQGSFSSICKQLYHTNCHLKLFCINNLCLHLFGNCFISWFLYFRAKSRSLWSRFRWKLLHFIQVG